MSHIADINININDLAALRAAVTELGAVWLEGQKTYKWFGRSVGDYPLPEGFSVEDLGKCEHAIRLPGCEYEIGVVRNRIVRCGTNPHAFHASLDATQESGLGYTLLYDFWSPKNHHRPDPSFEEGFEPRKLEDGTLEGGALLHKVFGVGLPKIKQFYGLHKATLAARAKGYAVTRKKVPGGIKLVVTGV